MTREMAAGRQPGGSVSLPRVKHCEGARAAPRAGAGCAKNRKIAHRPTRTLSPSHQRRTRRRPMICLLAATIGAGQGHQTALQTGPDTLPPYAGYVGITMPANITCNPSDPGDCKCEGLPIGPSTFHAASLQRIQPHVHLHDACADGGRDGPALSLPRTCRLGRQRRLRVRPVERQLRGPSLAPE